MLDHIREVGTWVNWTHTCDEVLVGDPDRALTGIAVGWMGTLDVLKTAESLGCNLFVTHEPLYVVEKAFFDYDVPLLEKKEWIDASGLCVLRCHDFWDDFPEVGIHGAWAKQLGLAGRPVEADKFYEIHDIGETTAGELARQVLERVSSLGQDCVHLVGDPQTKVTRLGIGTGAITNYKTMSGMGADVLLVTDDGTRLWESGQWSRDSGVPLLVVNHATAEEPGMVTLAEYIRGVFPGTPVHHLPVGCLYRTITRSG
ncbi:MAG: Nif3-like dinuclear metal center hexameric protein [Promethearchaeota archaeon]